MKKKQDQIRQMIEIIVKSQFDCSKQRCFVCRHHSGRYDCRLREIASKQAYALIKAGYGDVSEYKDEIQRLKNNEIVTIEVCNQVARESYKATRAKIKQAQIDVLNELKKKYGFYSCYSWNCDTKSLNEIIDELIKEVQNAEDKG